MLRCRAASRLGAVALAVAAVSAAGPAWPGGAASAAGPATQRGPGYLSVQGELVGVTTISVSDAWAVGNTTTRRLKPLLAHWNGRRWAAVKSPALPALGQLFGVARFRGGAFAVGNSGGGIGTFQPLILRLTGASARRMRTPGVPGAMLLGVAVTSPRNAWAVGQVSRGPALVLHWNGQRWSRVTLSAALGAKVLNGVAATSAANAWAIGNGAKGAPLILHWNGKRWNRAAFPAPSGSALRLRGLTATSAANAWAVGFTGGIADRATTVILHWNGRTWRRVPSPDPMLGSEGDGLLGVGASSARNAWAAGGGFSGLDGSIMIEHWDGAAWQAVPVPAEPGSLAGVSIGSSGRAWAVGQTLAPTEAEGTQTLILHWNGTAWHG